MKVIKKDLPKDVENVELHIFADEHIGDELCDIERLKARIRHVAETPNAYCVLNGDILDNASRSSIGDIETRELNIMEQIQKGVELFEPIKRKILCIGNGNHEARAFRKEGIDISKIIAMQLGLGDLYTSTSALLFLRFGKSRNNGGASKQLYTVYMLHGSGGGRKEGSKAIRLADMSSIVDADIFIHSHTHLPMVMKQAYHRIDRMNSTVALVNKLYVNSASNLNYGGYGEAQEFKPNSKDTPVIYLSGTKKEMTARL
jgi:predicted phosphodiesterase